MLYVQLGVQLGVTQPLGPHQGIQHFRELMVDSL